LLQAQDSCIRNTGDETWVHCDDLGKKHQSCNWKSPSPPQLKKVRQVKSNITSMWVTGFDCEGVVDWEFVPPSHVVSRHYNWEVLQHLRDQVCQKCPQLWWNHNWLVKHNNVPANTTLSLWQFLATTNMAAAHPRSTSDLAPFDLFLFPRMKSHLQ
jgi:Transposase.